MSLTERIDAAIKRITRGHGAMSIPPNPTDPDLVLADCRARLAEVERERDDWKSATLECDCDCGCGCFVRHLASTTLGAGWLSPKRVRELMERAWNFGAGPFDSMEHRASDARRKADIDALLAEVKP